MKDNKIINDFGVNDRYKQKIESLSNSELEDEYDKQKSRIKSSEKIIQPFIISIAFASIVGIARFYIWLVNNRFPILVKTYMIPVEQVNSLMYIFFYSIVCIILLITFTTMAVIGYLRIRNQRFMFLERIMKKRSLLL